MTIYLVMRSCSRPGYVIGTQKCRHGFIKSATCRFAYRRPLVLRKNELHRQVTTDANTVIVRKTYCVRLAPVSIIFQETGNIRQTLNMDGDEERSIAGLCRFNCVINRDFRIGKVVAKKNLISCVNSARVHLQQVQKLVHCECGYTLM